MGCFESRVDCEAALLLAEAGLGFSKHSVEKINITIRKFSHKSKVNQAQLERICNQLSLTIFPLTFHTQAFLNALRKADSAFSLKELLVIGVCLGSGTTYDKAALIYQIFDEYLENSIEKARVSGEILKTLSKISIEVMPNLIRGDKEYFLNLFEKQPLVIKSIINRFPDDLVVIKESDFVKSMCFIENGTLLSPNGWREYSRGIPSV